MALSGGVDSTVALHLLHRDSGPQTTLVGATHVVGESYRCCDAVALRRARAACARYGLPFFAVDLTAEFHELVVRDFIDAYLLGRTPNPCVLCNQKIRFGLFYRALERRLAQERILSRGDSLLLATGHYARIQLRGTERWLMKAADRSKDQSYMLYRIERGMLPKVVFPLGGHTKAEVKRIARENGLLDVRREESQDACFVEGRVADFLARQPAASSAARGGEIVSTDGRVLGRHGGCIGYTVGQRRGLGLAGGPWYVVAVDPGTSRLVVGRRAELARPVFQVAEANWLADAPAGPLRCNVKVRYQSRERPCTVAANAKKGVLTVQWEGVMGVTPGQSAVFYQGDRVLGGGFVL